MGKNLYEQLTTPHKGDYDVIVVGGGPAGSCAGIAAARAGARTLVIERMLFLGGMWTGGLVNPFFDYRLKKGLVAEIIREHMALGTWGGFGDMCFNYENMKRMLEEKLIAAGGEVLYNTQFCRTVMDGNRAVGVVVENKEGRQYFTAKVIVDCSGDADAAASAGVKTHKGRDEDGLCQAMTLMFTIGNVEFLQQGAKMLTDIIDEANAKAGNIYKLPYQRPYIIQIPNSKTAVVQLTHMRGYDPILVADVSKAAVEGRRQAYEVVEFLKHHTERFKDIELLETAPLLGIRESRRIVGEYTLTKEDLGEGRQYDDQVCDAAFGIDIHNPIDDSQQCYPVKRYGIPYRALIPKGVEGMLVAGRCISGTAEAMASYRVTGDCAAMGEAAGCAAAEAALRGIGVREVAIGDIMKHVNPESVDRMPQRI